MDRTHEGLQTLGKKTEYRMDYAPEVLETFENKHKGNDYWVQFKLSGVYVAVSHHGAAGLCRD